MGVEELRGRVEMDSYALIPGHTRFTDLLQAALVKLGYSEELTQARGVLQLRHWRPLPLEHVPETEDKTVAEVLGDVAPLATLHVRIYSSPWKVRCARDIKDRLLRLLLQQSHHLLVSAGCPLDELGHEE
ncbi:homeobox protein dve-1-like [Penaeus indicus]|uniref:homeobox protein dve-1-like n=1 Tax=Penaeus indicus TaxID=29960 RepID=UPI00300C29F9